MISIFCPTCNVKVAGWWDPERLEYVHHFEKDGKIFRHRWRVNNASATSTVEVPSGPMNPGPPMAVRIREAKPAVTVDRIPVDEKDPKAAWRIFDWKWRKWLSR